MISRKNLLNRIPASNLFKFLPKTAQKLFYLINDDSTLPKDLLNSFREFESEFGPYLDNEIYLNLLRNAIFVHNLKSVSSVYCNLEYSKLLELAPFENLTGHSYLQKVKNAFDLLNKKIQINQPLEPDNTFLNYKITIFCKSFSHKKQSWFNSNLAYDSPESLYTSIYMHLDELVAKLGLHSILEKKLSMKNKILKSFEVFFLF